MLGPAFEARSAASTRFLSFGTGGELEKRAPSLTINQQSEMQEKIHQYRSQNFGSRSSSENSWSGSSQSLLPLYLGRDERIRNSNYSHSNTSMIGRPITPAVFNYDITVPPPAVTPIRETSHDSGEHRRNESLTSNGLPAPPRQSRSPVLSQLLPEPRNSPSAYELQTESWIERQRSTNTFGRPDTPPKRSPSLRSEASVWSSASSILDPIFPRSPRQSTLDRSLSATRDRKSVV